MTTLSNAIGYTNLHIKHILRNWYAHINIWLGYCISLDKSTICYVGVNLYPTSRLSPSDWASSFGWMRMVLTSGVAVQAKNGMEEVGVFIAEKRRGVSHSFHLRRLVFASCWSSLFPPEDNMLPFLAVIDNWLLETWVNDAAVERGLELVFEANFGASVCSGTWSQLHKEDLTEDARLR